MFRFVKEPEKPKKEEPKFNQDLAINEGVAISKAITEDKKITYGMLTHPNQKPTTAINFASPNPIPSFFLICL